MGDEVNEYCKVCSAKTVKQRVRCINCKLFSHTSCAEKKKFETFAICCEKEVSAKEVMSDEWRISSLCSIISSLQETIKSKDEMIQIQKLRIDDLIKFSVNKAVNQPVENGNVDEGIGNPLAPNATEAANVRLAANSAWRKNPQRNDYSKLEKAQMDTMKEIINLSDNTAKPESIAGKSGTQAGKEDDFQEVVYRKSLRRATAAQRQGNTVMGSGKSENSNLAAPPKRAWLYVSNCVEQTTCEVLSNHIKGIIADVDSYFFEISEVTTKSKKKSFKIGVDFKFKDTLMLAESWPERIFVRRFILRHVNNDAKGNLNDNVGPSNSSSLN